MFAQLDIIHQVQKDAFYATQLLFHAYRALLQQSVPLASRERTSVVVYAKPAFIQWQVAVHFMSLTAVFVAVLPYAANVHLDSF